MLSEPHEDYLERILELTQEKGYARVSDLASKLAVKPASVTKMLVKLSEMGYLEREPYRGFRLTAKGKAAGKKVQKSHDLLYDLFTRLGVDPKTALRDTEGLEHHLSPDSLQALTKLLETLPGN